MKTKVPAIENARHGYPMPERKRVPDRILPGSPGYLPVHRIAELTRDFLSGHSDKPAYCMLIHAKAAKGPHGETELGHIGVFASPPLGLSDPDREVIPLDTPGECRAFTTAISVCKRACPKKLPPEHQA